VVEVKSPTTMVSILLVAAAVASENLWSPTARVGFVEDELIGEMRQK
jgi:hypothetical protein